MLSSLYFSLVMALDPNAGEQPVRELLKLIPKKDELIVGTFEGESPFSFEFDWSEPAQPAPNMTTAKNYVSWNDSYLLKEGSHMMVGKKKIEFGCAVIIGTSLSAWTPENPEYLIEVLAYPKHWRCGTAEKNQANPNWMRFTYNTKRPDQVLGPEFSHLYNRFNAVHAEGF